MSHSKSPLGGGTSDVTPPASNGVPAGGGAGGSGSGSGYGQRPPASVPAAGGSASRHGASAAGGGAGGADVSGLLPQLGKLAAEGYSMSPPEAELQVRAACCSRTCVCMCVCACACVCVCVCVLLPVPAHVCSCKPYAPMQRLCAMASPLVHQGRLGPQSTHPTSYPGNHARATHSHSHSHSLTHSLIRPHTRRPWRSATPRHCGASRASV
jgi:hypothetical protein